MDATVQRAPGKHRTSAARRLAPLPRFLAVPLSRLRTALLITFLALLATAPAHAQVRFDMFVGYDSIVPQGSWFPITFEVFNDGPPFTALLEVAPGNNPAVGQTRSMYVELPKGTTKRFILPAYSAPNSWNTYWSAHLLDERGRKRGEAQSTRLRVQDSSIPLAAAVSRTPPVLPEKAVAKNQPVESQQRIARVQVLIFPDNPIALEGLETIYLSSEKLFDMTKSQGDALMAWLHAGGHLIVSVEQVNHFDGPGEWLKGVLPAQVTGLGSMTAHGALHDWLTSRKRFDGRDYSFTGSTRVGRSVSTGASRNPYADLTKDDKFEETPLQTAELKLRDGQVLIGTESAPLAVFARRGRGQITMLAFAPELEPFKSWKQASHFWAKMTDLPPEILTENASNQNRYGGRSIDGVFGAMVDSDQVRKLPVAWLLLLLVAYLAVIGPLDQYWLKKLNKQMLTWITFPLYVAFFSALIYFIGYKLRAGESEWNELHVVDVIPHVMDQGADLRGWTFGSIYSPVNARYNVASEQPFATLRGESGGNYGVNQESSKARVEQRGNTFHGVLDVPVWTSQLFISDWWGRQSAPLKVTVTDTEVTVENRLETKLQNARLVFNNEVLELGEVPPRKAQTFSRSAASKLALKEFVSRHGGNFQETLNSRGRAFGDNTFARLPDKPNATMAASFVAQINTQSQNNYYNTLFTPPGFELTPVVQRGDAVLLAFAPDYAPVKSLNKFNARRNNRNTLFRVVVETKN